MSSDLLAWRQHTTSLNMPFPFQVRLDAILKIFAQFATMGVIAVDGLMATTSPTMSVEKPAKQTSRTREVNAIRLTCWVTLDRETHKVAQASTAAGVQIPEESPNPLARFTWITRMPEQNRAIVVYLQASDFTSPGAVSR
jgi:hypothetical protein